MEFYSFFMWEMFNFACVNSHSVLWHNMSVQIGTVYLKR